MSEVIEQASSEATEAATTKAKRPPTVVEDVTMSDGRKVGFPGKTKLKKEWLDDMSGVRFDFRNGATRTVLVNGPLLLAYACHGASQKVGDESSGEEDVDDMLVATDEIIARLAGGSWTKERAGGTGDSFKGAHIVMQAIMEYSGKDLEFVKAYIDKRLSSTEGLKRKDLYDSFRNPDSPTGKIIQRLEDEKRRKGSKIDASAELAAIMG
jgi:hypothetical protein